MPGGDDDQKLQGGGVVDSTAEGEEDDQHCNGLQELDLVDYLVQCGHEDFLLEPVKPDLDLDLPHAAPIEQISAIT